MKIALRLVEVLFLAYTVAAGDKVHEEDKGTTVTTVADQQLPVDKEVLLYRFSEEDYEFEPFDQNFQHIEERVKRTSTSTKSTLKE